MVDWRRSTWGDEIELRYGRALRTHGDAGGSVRVYGSNGPIGWTEEALADGPGVILGRKGAYRGVEYSRGPFFVIDTAYYAVAKSNLSMRWLYYAMIYHRLGEIDDGSPIPSTTRAAVYPRQLDVPAIEEQIAIAGVLGALDDKVEQNNALSRRLEEFAQSVFVAWFVNFDPVFARAAGEQTYAGMDSAVFSRLPAEFDETGLPTGWRNVRLDEVARIVMGQSPPSESVNHDGIGVPFHQGVSHYGVRFPSPRVHTTDRKRLAARGDVLVSVRAPVGRVNVADSEIVLGRGLAGLRHLRDRQSYLLYLVRHLFAEEDQVGEGTIYRAVTRELLSRLSVTVVPTWLEDAYETLIAPSDDLILRLHEETRELSSTRDELLDELMSQRVVVEAGNA